MTEAPSGAADAARRLPYRRCVGVMLLNDAGRVFTGQRIDTPMPAWQMPQGGIDPGEDPRAAALRELEEETGITPDLVAPLAESPGWIRYDLPPELVPRTWGGRYRGQEQRWFLFRFTGRDEQVRIATAHPEFSAWRWQDPARLVADAIPFKRDAYAAVLRAFADWLD